MAKQVTSANGKAKEGRALRKRPTRSNGVIELSSELQEALRPAVEVLRRMARYKMEPFLARRMTELGERKEFLTKKEHDELMQFVDFWQNRTNDKLQALFALKNLREVCPKLLRNR
jgi:hypothetical protein